jgi:PAS domain S-box-containing protein
MFGAFAAPFIASFLDIGFMRLVGWGEGEFWYLWRVRFLSNVSAAITIVPFVLAWAQGGRAVLRRARWPHYAEAAALMIGLFVVGYLTFSFGGKLIPRRPVLWHVPLLLWATVRFGQMGLTGALAVVMVFTVGASVRGLGPFAAESTEINAVSLQLFLIVLSIPLLALAAVLEERRQAVRVARANQERLAFALHAAHLNTWEWKPHEKKLIWSEPGQGAFASNGDSIDPGAYSVDVIHPDDQSALEAAVSHATSRDAACDVEFRIVRNGAIRWFLSRGKVFHDEAGHPTCMLGIGMDITGRKRAEQELFETTSRNLALLEAIPDMMFVMDLDGTYLDHYTRDPSQLFVPPEVFLGRNVRDILPEPQARNVLASIERLRRGEQPQVLEYSLPIRGEDRYFEARLVTSHTNHVVSIVRDITEHRRAIAAARESQEKLRQSNNQIRDLAARLITAQESERRRIALLLHDDVNQNIAVMGLAVSRLKSKAAGNEEIVSGLDGLAQQTQSLTAQLRELSHDLHPGILEHLGLVAALKSHLADMNEESQIQTTFTARVGREPIPLNVAVCLYRVAIEAIHNASRHSGATMANIMLRDENGVLTLEVWDSGRGFDVEKARQGAGIGLASLEERVRLLQGSFEVRSSPKTGTALIARVPRSA